ncbi:MAG: phosphoglycerate mutase family protein [Thermomonas sp.]|uniref:SixA phosphatase family protein n=1 Tax=Thermomonas sp. TaxID=1971895 RepID=UPI0039E63589
MRILLTSLIACCLLAACAGTPPSPSSSGSTFILVRHAEKDTSIPRDPPLTAEGVARAERLAVMLGDVALDAIYSSPYQRTLQTAAPTAHAHALPVREYDPGDATAFATRLRAEHPTGTVLVVGHSNTLPPLARALCGCTVADMDEAIYGIRYTIDLNAQGRARLRESRD